MIPLIHRFWRGKTMPLKYQWFGEGWREMNPRYAVIDWTMEMLPLDLVSRPVIEDIVRRGGDSEEASVQIADLVGYELMAAFGGVYVNCDIEPLRPLVELYAEFRLGFGAWAAMEDDDFIVNAVLGSDVVHLGLWKHVVATACAAYWENPTAEMVHTTGPQMLTPALKSWAIRAGHNAVTVLPAWTYNPHHWSTIERGTDATGRDHGQAYGVHHWGHRKSGRSNRVGV